MNAPRIAELLGHPMVLEALENAWADSLGDDPILRHEEGGWIYSDVTAGSLIIRRAASGGQADLDLESPPIIEGAVVVATFHTHPNPTSEGWEPGPSAGDIHSAILLGVPCLIRADNGIYTTGPNARRGGLAGEPGFPR